MVGLMSRPEAKDPTRIPGQRTPLFGQQNLADAVTCLSTNPYKPYLSPDDSCPGWDPPGHLCHARVLASHSFIGNHLRDPWAL